MQAGARPTHDPEMLLIQKSVASFEEFCGHGFYKRKVAKVR